MPCPIAKDVHTELMNVKLLVWTMDLLIDSPIHVMKLTASIAMETLTDVNCVKLGIGLF